MCWLRWRPWPAGSRRSWPSPPILLSDIHLDGRGLILLPSFFCWRAPTTLRHTDGAHPIQHDRTWLASGRTPSRRSLAALLGRTRATVLQTLAEAPATPRSWPAASVSRRPPRASTPPPSLGRPRKRTDRVRAGWPGQAARSPGTRAAKSRSCGPRRDRRGHPGRGRFPRELPAGFPGDAVNHFGTRSVEEGEVGIPGQTSPPGPGLWHPHVSQARSFSFRPR
jgi:hypothetical protein